jgi:DNA-binding beta-propeller fold protein YncE
MAPDPVDLSRPDFIGFSEDDSAQINVALDDPVVMIFNKEMDLNSFKDNFTLESVSGEIGGVFNYAQNTDTVVVFSPSEDMKPAEIYTAYIYGGVMSTNGMQMISPNDSDVPQETSFFTEGQYSQDGYPHVFFSDKNGQELFLIAEMDSFLDKRTITTETTFGSGEMRVTPDGSKLVIVNRLAQGTVSIYDPLDMSELATVEVGVGPDDLFLTNDLAFVSNLSGRTISVVDLATFTEKTVINYADGFRPRDIVYAEKTNKLYISSNKNGEYDKLRIVDASDYNNYYDVLNVTPNGKQTVDMEISADGEYIFIAELNTTELSVFSTTQDTVVNTIDQLTTKNEDGAIAGNYYYLASNSGSVFKIGISNQFIEEQIDLDKVATGIAASVAGEILYIVTPSDSTAQILATRPLTKIGVAKIPGILRRTAISVQNY